MHEPRLNAQLLISSQSNQHGLHDHFFGVYVSVVKNASQPSKVYYGLHFCAGVAEYREPDQEPYRIFISETTAKQMDATFPGKPVYVQHVDKVDLSNLQVEADGYVSESFYNKSDGKHWAKFIVISDDGHEAIRNGWTLSNAYVPQTYGIGGLWHGVDYAKEVLSAQYEHLALVPDPRYQESIILTAEEFKKYNNDKEQELKLLANSKGEKSVFNFFKKTKVENSTELSGMSLILPKSKKEISIAKLVNDADSAAMKGPLMADMDARVTVGASEMTVNDLVSKYMASMKSNEDEPEDDDSFVANDDSDDSSDADASADVANKKKNKKKNMKDSEPGNKDITNDDSDDSEDDAAPVANKKKNKKMNEDAADDSAVANDDSDEDSDKDSEVASKKKNKKMNSNFETLKNAPTDAIAPEVLNLELSQDMTARGVERYGSKK